MYYDNHLEFRKDYIYWRPSGNITPILLIAMFKKVAEECDKFGAKSILLDARSLTAQGFATMDRFHVAVEISKFWNKSVKVAVVSNPSRDDVFDEFALISAKNRGIAMETFGTEGAALRWVLQQNTETAQRAMEMTLRTA
jgi:hypothetical protein